MLFVGVAVFLIFQIRKGNIYKPIFLLSSAYVLVLVIGAFGFEYFRQGPGKAHLLPLIGLSFIAMIAGMQVARFRLLYIQRYYEPLQRFKSAGALLGFTMMCIVAAVLFFVRAGGPPILSSGAGEARMAAMSGSGYISIFVAALPIICLFLWYEYLTYPSARLKVTTFCLGAFTILVFSLLGSRSVTVTLVAQMVVIYAIVRRRTFPIRYALLGLVMVYLFVGALGAYRHSDGDVTSETFRGELAVVFTARVVVLDKILQHVKHRLGGETYLNDLAKLLPGQQTGTGVMLKEMLMKNNDMPDTAGITPSLLGEFFVNFGFYGTIVGMFFFGFIAQRLYQRLVFKNGRNSVIMYAVIIVTMVGSLQSGIGPRLIPLMIAMLWTSVIGIIASKKLVVA